MGICRHIVKSNAQASRSTRAWRQYTVGSHQYTRPRGGRFTGGELFTKVGLPRSLAGHRRGRGRCRTRAVEGSPQGNLT
ncbi:hypothetical protein O3P69_006723 [Scylla paramamosain]|uniref:Uncharacterized protein n=1 Tax=Scylla paramamosain TaxID=85552 RepID=A0AAW0U0M7_SCYPA